RRSARLAPGVVGPDRGRAQGRDAREPELDRLRTGERDRLPHVHGVRARPVCRTVLQLPAGANAENPTRRALHLQEGRVPGLGTAKVAIVNLVVQYTTTVDRAFAALGDPTRRAVLERLGAGSATISE